MITVTKQLKQRVHNVLKDCEAKYHQRCIWHRGCKGSKLTFIADKRENVTPPTIQQFVASTGGSKMDRCKAMFNANKNLSRQQIIEMFVKDIGMTPAGAATYYYNVKKG